MDKYISIQNKKVFSVQFSGIVSKQGNWSDGKPIVEDVIKLLRNNGTEVGWVKGEEKYYICFHITPITDKIVNGVETLKNYINYTDYKKVFEKDYIKYEVREDLNKPLSGMIFLENGESFKFEFIDNREKLRITGFETKYSYMNGVYSRNTEFD